MEPSVGAVAAAAAGNTPTASAIVHVERKAQPRPPGGGIQLQATGDAPRELKRLVRKLTESAQLINDSLQSVTIDPLDKLADVLDDVIDEILEQLQRAREFRGTLPK